VHSRPHAAGAASQRETVVQCGATRGEAE